MLPAVHYLVSVASLLLNCLLIAHNFFLLCLMLLNVDATNQPTNQQTSQEDGRGG